MKVDCMFDVETYICLCDIVNVMKGRQGLGGVREVIKSVVRITQGTKAGHSLNFMMLAHSNISLMFSQKTNFSFIA